MDAQGEQGKQSHTEARRHRVKEETVGPPEVWQVVVECRDEAEQRELFERMREEGRKVRLLVL